MLSGLLQRVLYQRDRFQNPKSICSLKYLIISPMVALPLRNSGSCGERQNCSACDRKIKEGPTEDRDGLFGSGRSGQVLRTLPKPIIRQHEAACRYSPCLVLPSKYSANGRTLWGLDAFTRRHMRELLTRLWERQRMTVFFVTHDVQEAVFLSDLILIINNQPGRVIEKITIDITPPRRSQRHGLSAVRCSSTPGAPQHPRGNDKLRETEWDRLIPPSVFF